MDVGQRRVEIALSDVHNGVGELFQWSYHLIDGPCTEDEERREAHDEDDGAVFHDLMGQRQGHTVACEVEEQGDSHQKDACSNTHDSETESCSKRLLISEVVLVFKVRLLYQGVYLFYL